MMRILIVQSRTSEDSLERERKNFCHATEGCAAVEFLSALDDRLTSRAPHEILARYDGMIFGGSADFDFHGGRSDDDPARLMAAEILERTRRVILQAIGESKPLLGVCFGHQLIALMHGGEVHCDTSQGKSGSHEIHLTEEGAEDRLFKELPPRFIAQYWHKDSVTSLPEGATLLATGPSCRFSALRYGENVYTMQFHPEVERIIVDDNPRPSPEASRLIPLWIERIAGSEQLTPRGDTFSSQS